MNNQKRIVDYLHSLSFGATVSSDDVMKELGLTRDEFQAAAEPLEEKRTIIVHSKFEHRSSITGEVDVRLFGDIGLPTRTF